MPPEATVRLWAIQDVKGFSAQYTQAREIGYLVMADELLEVADDGRNDWLKEDEGYKLNGEHVQRSRLRIDTRKWLLSKALPKLFGDKITQSVQNLDASGNPIAPKLHVTVEQLGDPAPPRVATSTPEVGPRFIGGVDLVG